MPLGFPKLGRLASVRERLRKIIFEAETPAGKAFDLLLLVSILMSVAAVLMSSIHAVNAQWGKWVTGAEWFFTILFTLEYAVRLWTVKSSRKYALSFFGVVDLAAILPTYASLLILNAEYLIVLRLFRVMRVFRILKLIQYMDGSRTIMRALRASRHKITVFLFAVVVLVTIIGSLMYLIEGEKHGFTSIPTGIYWAIVTLTTVGYGDIAPQTVTGKMLACVVMILGYGIIAVPTGIVTSEMTRFGLATTTRGCRHCSAEGHLDDATYCRRCGKPLAALVKPAPD